MDETVNGGRGGLTTFELSYGVARRAPEALQQDLDCPLAGDVNTRLHSEVPVAGVATPTGSITLGGSLVLVDEIDTHLCAALDVDARHLALVDSVDARRVTFLGCAGLTVLVRVARARGPGVPLWASPAAVRPLLLTGLDRFFEVHSAT